MSDAEFPGIPTRADVLRDRRVQYESAGLDVGDLATGPVEQWRRWHDQALDAGVAEPNAMTVATVGADGVPDARIVLARGADAHGLVFYTNYEGAKSRQLDLAPVAAAVFAWLDLHRQVRLRARVERVAPEESDAYFASRPRGSQLGAWASPQSDVIADRSLLDDRVAQFDRRFAEGRRPASGELGRMASDPVRVGVLAGPAEPAPRPAPLPVARRPARLAHRPPRPLTLPFRTGSEKAGCGRTRQGQPRGPRARSWRRRPARR